MRRGAAVVAVVSGLVVGLAPTVTAGPPPDPTREVLAAIPLEHRFSCRERDPANATSTPRLVNQAAASISVAVGCDRASGDQPAVDYYLFSSAEAMNATYQAYATGDRQRRLRRQLPAGQLLWLRRRDRRPGHVLHLARAQQRAGDRADRHTGVDRRRTR